jgi:hypothetical protein
MTCMLLLTSETSYGRVILDVTTNGIGSNLMPSFLDYFRFFSYFKSLIMIRE